MATTHAAAGRWRHRRQPAHAKQPEPPAPSSLIHSLTAARPVPSSSSSPKVSPDSEVDRILPTSVICQVGAGGCRRVQAAGGRQCVADDTAAAGATPPAQTTRAFSAHVGHLAAVHDDGVVGAAGRRVGQLLDGQRAQRLVLAIKALLQAGKSGGRRRAGAGSAAAQRTSERAAPSHAQAAQGRGRAVGPLQSKLQWHCN